MGPAIHLLVILAGMAPAPQAATAPPLVVLSPKEVGRIERETCRGAGGSVDVDHARFLRSPVRVRTHLGAARVRIQGEHLLIDVPGQRTYFNNMRYEVSPPGEDLDIDLQLGRFAGRLGIYWRETFRHHPYRLGVYLIDTEAAARMEGPRPLTLLCTGEGGMRSED